MGLNQTIILAGGFGTRLKSISNGIPKALMPIGYSFYLDLLLEKVFKYDIAHVYLSLYYKSELFIDYINSGKYKNIITSIIGTIRYWRLDQDYTLGFAYC